MRHRANGSRGYRTRPFSSATAPMSTNAVLFQPRRLANRRGDPLRLPCKSGLHPASSSICAFWALLSSEKPETAQCNAVSPSLSLAFALPPRCKRARTVSTLPKKDAPIRGVHLWRSRTFTVAPASRRRSTTSAGAKHAAHQSAVTPLRSRAWVLSSSTDHRAAALSSPGSAPGYASPRRLHLGRHSSLPRLRPRQRHRLPPFFFARGPRMAVPQAGHNGARREPPREHWSKNPRGSSRRGAALPLSSYGGRLNRVPA